MGYPSGNLVVQLAQKRYTKHYYINNKRFASRIGLIDDNFVSAGVRMINSLANQKTQIQPIENVIQLDNQYVTYGAAENTTPDDYPDCSSQLQALLEELNPTSNPIKAHCYQYVLDRMNANSNPCVALEEVNKYICEEIEVPDPDPGTPTYTPEQIDQADCLYLLNLWIVMANGLLYDENDRCYINKCYDAGLRYIQNNYVSSPSNVCEIYKYVIENYKCEPEQELETPTEPIKIPIDWVDEGANSNTIEPGYDEGFRKPIWWYHTDHLGSSSYITDNFGRPSHYYDQLPFGESMVEHNQSSYYNNGYKFNGKEQDEATGMYYYGARYYDPRISIFISVDPLAEKTMEPYSYVGNNPIMFTDPTGMSKQEGDTWIVNGETGDSTYIDDGSNDIVIVNGSDYNATIESGQNAFGECTGVCDKSSSEIYQTYLSTGIRHTADDFDTGNKSANQNIRTLDPRARPQMIVSVIQARIKGLDVRGAVLGGYRTYSEQDGLYAKGRTAPGLMVTKAKGGYSNHNFGLSMDVAIFENGIYLTKGTEPQYKMFGEITESNGLQWGGRWKDMFDPAHVEINHGYSMKELRALPKDNKGYIKGPIKKK